MSRLPTADEDARWTPHGLAPDPTLPDRITIHCGRPDRIGKCRVRADLDGAAIYYDTTDPFNAHFRRLFVEAVYEKANGEPPNESVDLRWLGDAVIRAAESVRTTASTVSDIERYTPFPIEALPAAARGVEP